MNRTKYAKISSSIEEKIRNGEYRGRLPGLYNLAKQHKTTHVTVSKAIRLLEGKGLLTINGTRGTFVSSEASSQKHRVVCVVGMERGHSSDHSDLDVIESVASKFRYRVIALSDSPGLAELFADTPEFICKIPADGFIFAQSALTSELATVMRGSGIPFISLNCIKKPRGVSFVDYNSEDGVERLIKRLILLKHERIAYIGYNNLFLDYTDRIRKVFCNALSEINPYCGDYFFTPMTQKEYFKRYGSFYHDSFAADATRWLNGLVGMPTAVIVAGSHIGECLIENLERNGIAVPGDISVVAYTDMLPKDNRIACMYYDLAERASFAANTLLNQMKYMKTTVVQEFLTGRFMEGDSLRGR
jgi:DNA-binding LacI/PurR family transcriptional regulator